MIDLDQTQLDEVRNILKGIVPDCEIRVFGSRVDGRAQKFSDLDIALVCPGRLDQHILGKVKDAFAESDLPIQVDVHDWYALSSSFKKIIESSFEIID